jgi:hypothetical protein
VISVVITVFAVLGACALAATLIPVLFHGWRWLGLSGWFAFAIGGALFWSWSDLRGVETGLAFAATIWIVTAIDGLRRHLGRRGYTEQSMPGFHACQHRDLGSHLNAGTIESHSPRQMRKSGRPLLVVCGRDRSR